MKMGPIRIGKAFAACISIAMFFHSRPIQGSQLGKIDMTFNKELEITSSLGQLGNQFYYPSVVDADSEGNIIIIEPTEARIQIFDARGLFVKSIGGKGQGPGEFETPILLSISKKREIYVGDIVRRTITIFSATGHFVKSIHIPSGMWMLKKFVVDSKENIICGFVPMGHQRYTVAKYDPSFGLLKTIAEFNEITSLLVFGGISFLPPRYSPSIIWDLDENDNLVICKNDVYELLLFDATSRLINRNKIDHASEAISRDERDSIIAEMGERARPYIDKISIPKVKPPIMDLVKWDKYLFVLRTTTGDQRSYDVLDEKLRAIGQIRIPFKLFKCRDDKAYSIEARINPETEELEDIRISRYGIMDNYSNREH